MADTPIDSFLVDIGFAKPDTASARAAVDAVNKAETAITAAQTAETNRRVAAEIAASDQRIKSAKKEKSLKLAMLDELVNITNAVEAMRANQSEKIEQERADKAESIRKAESDAINKREAENLKKAIERRNALLKSTKDLALGMVSVFTGLAAGVTGAATGLLWATDRAAKGFERLAYAGQMSGSSARGLSRVGYAASQSGTTAEDAQGSVNAFGENLKKLPALEGILRSMGIATRDANGQLRDASALMVEYIDHLKELPQLQREARTGVWGITDTTTRAVLRDGFHNSEGEYDRIQGAVGADPNAAAQGAVGFEQAMRRGFEIIGAVKTKVETSLFELIKPRLDDISKWVLDHGDAISNVITSITKGLTDLATAFVKSDAVQGALTGLGDGLERMAKYVGSDAFKKDVQGFVDDVKALAHAIRDALEWLGVLPSKAGAAVVPNPEGTEGGGTTGGFGASLRNRRGGQGHQESNPDVVHGRLDNFRHGRNMAFGDTGMTAASKDLTPEGRALLDTLASGEAKDYNVLNGGGTFDDYSHHPGGRAAGRYQFLPSTWNEVRDATGAKDFGPEAQDKGAWWLAQRDYKKRTNRDLQGDLGSKDPSVIAGIGKALGSTWVSLDDQFGAKYDHFLKRQAQPVPNAGSAASGDVAGDLSGQATFSNGQLDSTKGLIFHHTGGRGTPEGVVGTLNQRGLGVQYVMDRDGKIFRTLPEGARGAHILRSEINDLNNGNTRGVEVIAKDDSDVTPAQIASGKAFAEAMSKKYPGLQVFGHGEVNPHHKQASEGHAIVEAFRSGHAAPATDPKYKPAPIPIEQRNLSTYMGRDSSLKGEPVKVAVTDDSAAKIGKGFVSSFPAGTVPRSGNPLADLHASWQRYAEQHGKELVHPGQKSGSHPGPFHTSPLGITPGLHQAYNNSRNKGDTNITHSPTFNIHGGDTRASMDHARMVADRGARDLVRNLKTAEQ